jgi:hypothetical protein
MKLGTNVCMLKELRCDNEERVWEATYAVAYVEAFRRHEGAGYGLHTSVAAARDADLVADLAVTSLRALRGQRNATDG